MKTAAKYLFLLLTTSILLITCKKEKNDIDNPQNGILQLETYDATNIQGSSALLHGELISMSTPGVKEFGFIIDTAGTAGRAEYRRLSMGNYLKKPSVFQTIVSSLPKGPTYYFKAFAVDDDNIEATGSEKSFTLAEFSLTFFFPSSGSMMDIIYLYGNNFGGETANPMVIFDEVPATILWAGQDTLMVQVPKPGISTHKLSTIRVSINGVNKEYSNKFEYNPLYAVPDKLTDYSLESAFFINGKHIGYSTSLFSEFNEQLLDWNYPWDIEMNMYTQYCLVFNNYLYALVTDQLSNHDYYFFKYDLNQKSYIALNCLTDSLYFPAINYYYPDRSVNQLFSINNYIYQAFIVFIDRTPFPDIIYLTNELWKYDVFGNNWSKMNDIPDTGMIFTVNDQAYLLNNEHMYQYNANTDIWDNLNISTLPQINDSTYRTQFHYAYNGLDYFFNWDSEEIWSFDPNTNTWTFFDNTPVPIIDPLMFQKDNMFFVQEKDGNTIQVSKAWLYFILDE